MLCIVGCTTLADSRPAVTESSAAGAGSGLLVDRLERIDSAINDEIDAGRIPGAVALIMRNGEMG